MWMMAAIALFVAGTAVLVAIEFIRSAVHRHRERRYGIGGTQDVAMWGTFITIALWFCAAACAVIWLAAG